MKILVFTRSTSTINQFRPEAEIFCRLAELGHFVTVITHTIPEQLERFKEANVNVIDHQPNSKISLQSIKLIRQELAKNSYDIMYACCSKTIPNAAFACIGFKVKLIAYRGTSGGMYRKDPSNYLCMLHPRINGVICVSNTVKQHVIKKVRHSIKKNIETIYKGHDLTWYNKPAIELNTIESSKKNFNVLCIASPRPHKGLKYLLESAKYLKDIDNLKIILVGTDIKTEQFTSLINNSGMCKSIIQLGYRQDVPQIAAACDILILPSIREGLPRAILESLASGTPVITSANAGAIEIIENDKNGYIVPIADSKAIAERIRHLYNNQDVLPRLSKNALNTIKTKMSHKETVKKIIAYFEKIRLQP